MSELCISIPVNTPEEIDLVAGTLSGILKNPNEIAPETQQGVIAKSFELLEALDGDYTVAVQEQSVTGILNMAGQVSKTCGRIGDVNHLNNTAIMPLKSLYPNSTYMMEQVIEYLYF